MKGKVLAQNQSVCFHVISIIVALVLCVVGGVLYSSQYDKVRNEVSFDTISNLMICVIMICFGIALLIINFEIKWIKCLLLVLLGAVIMSVVLSPQFRLGIILLCLVIISGLVCIRFKNIFSTAATFCVCACVFLVLTLLLFKIPDVNADLLIYSMLSLFMLCYRVFGVKINQWFIGSCMGYKSEVQFYDDEQLKNQIFLLYLIIFVVINIMLYLGKTDSGTWNLVNNSFLTGLAIIQVDWKKIVFYFKRER